MQKNLIPAPGSQAAISQGCTCPVIDNHHGRGYGANWPKYGWIIFEDCPLHGNEGKADEEFQYKYR